MGEEETIWERGSGRQGEGGEVLGEGRWRGYSVIGESGRERERTKCLWAVIRNQAILSTKIDRVKSPKFFVAKKKLWGAYL